MHTSPVIGIKSTTSSTELVTTEMTISSAIVPHDDPLKLKRTFTLPWRRQPAPTTPTGGTIPTATTSNSTIAKDQDPGTSTPTGPNPEEQRATKRVFRRPSLRKFINRLAQQISGNVIQNHHNQSTLNGNLERVPPVVQTWAPEDIPGVTGLKNHGNTCFINAVIQCISHTDILAEYFVLDRYKVDLMRRNKLNSKKYGTRGEVTEHLAVLLKALWACQYTPELSTTFKQTVERHGAQYKGNQQHDALEFLQWLLDKVHEDLNTASKRKYKSIKTSGRPDEVIAAETLENYKRCNNSFIQSVFQAQYRSSLSCSRCHTQSNTFDPFQCISVQLPQFTKHSIYVTVVYTSQQPRQVQIGLSVPSGATISELRDILESDTSIQRSHMLLTEIGENGFLRNFTDSQSVNCLTDYDPIYCIEVAHLKDALYNEQSTSAYILLCWINTIVETTGGLKRFGSPYVMQVARETNYDDLQKLILKEMSSILHDDILTSAQHRGVFKIRISDPACAENEPHSYLDPHLEHPLFMEAIDQALALCSEEGGPPHLKLVLEFSGEAKSVLIADDSDLFEEHSSVKQLREQALNGGVPLTLEECLRDYTEAETLTDAWRCPHCQQYQPVVKTLDIWSLPDILIVHFKRFRQQQNLRGGGCSTTNGSAKLTTMVEFPVGNFDMSPHLAATCGGGNGDEMDGTANWSPWRKSGRKNHHNHHHHHNHQIANDNDNIYDLYGVCYHHGTDLETGHYTAACRNFFDNNWYQFDDGKVTNLSNTTDDINSVLVNNSAYILFYQKRNTNYFNSGTNSSAASTSSVSSNNNNNNTNNNNNINCDHWVVKMAKFQPPKHIKSVDLKSNPINCSNKPVVKDDDNHHLDNNNVDDDNGDEMKKHLVKTNETHSNDVTTTNDMISTE